MNGEETLGLPGEPDAPDGAPQAGAGLRQRSVQGALWLAARDGTGTLVRLGGVLLLTVMLGPTGFGIYTGGVAIVSFVATLAQLSVEVYLIKHDGPLDRTQLGTAYACLLLTSAVTVGGALALLLGLSAAGVHLPDRTVLSTLLVLLASVPANVLWAPAQAQLERRYAFRQLGAVELAGDVVLYGTALTLVKAGAGPVGAAVGYLLWQIWVLVASHVAARAWPVLVRDRAALRAMLRFGLVATGAGLLQRGRELINPLVVGPMLGAAAVGQVSLAIRIVETLSIVSRTTLRLSYITLAAVRDDRGRTRQVLAEGGSLAVAGLAAPLCAACLLGPWALPLLFGQEWRPSVDVLSLLAVAAAGGAVSLLPASLLVVQGAQGRVTVASAVRLAVQVCAALVLLPLVGLTGYGLAAVVSLLGDLLVLRAVAQREGGLPLAGQLVWGVALVPLALAPLVPLPVLPLLALPLLVLGVLPRSRAQLVATPQMLLAAVRRR